MRLLSMFRQTPRIGFWALVFVLLLGAIFYLSRQPQQTVRTPPMGSSESQTWNSERTTDDPVRDRSKISEQNVEEADAGFSLPEAAVSVIESPTPALSEEALEKLHRAQLLEIERELADPAARVPLPPSDDIPTDMSMAELDALHERQTSEVGNSDIEPRWLELPESVDGRLVISELALEEMHRSQVQSLRATDGLLKLPLVAPDEQGLITSEQALSDMLKLQQSIAEAQAKDDSTAVVLPESSDPTNWMTETDIARLHTEQLGSTGSSP